MTISKPTIHAINHLARDSDAAGMLIKVVEKELRRRIREHWMSHALALLCWITRTPPAPLYPAPQERPKRTTRTHTH